MKGEKMEKVKRICFVWLALLPLLALAQQEPTFEKLLVPDRKVFDFGTIQEKDGPVSHSFTLKNTSDKPIAISEVSAWCGCTTAQFDKRPIRPGQSGRVVVTFNPSHRPGAFSKEVVVLLGDGSSYVRLWVKGTVKGMQHPVTEDHPYHYGSGLYMSHRVLPFRALKKGEAQTIKLRLANGTNREMTIDFLRQPNNRIVQMPERIVLKPQERRVVDVSYRAVREYPYRRRIDVVPVVGGKRLEALRLTLLPSKLPGK